MAIKVFISWSGDLSNKLADAVRQWLPAVLQFVKPYFTPSDIEKGTKWATEISEELSSSDIGIICLTKDNLNKPWILFESGALSKNLDKARVCTLLFNMETTDLTGPLTIFQNTKFNKDDFKKLVKAINNAGNEVKLDDSVFDEVFEMWWPKLEEKVKNILKEHNHQSDENKHRTEREILEEILELTRLNTRHYQDAIKYYSMDYDKFFSKLRHNIDWDKKQPFIKQKLYNEPLTHLCNEDSPLLKELNKYIDRTLKQEFTKENEEKVDD